jgi:hypothetical protein
MSGTSDMSFAGRVAHYNAGQPHTIWVRAFQNVRLTTRSATQEAIGFQMAVESPPQRS